MTNRAPELRVLYFRNAAKPLNTPFIWLATCALSFSGLASPASGAEQLVLVVGAGGTVEFETEFNAWATEWKALADRRDLDLVIVEQSSESQKTNLQSALKGVPNESDRLWLVLIGHGTYAGGDAKFNLVGPDVSADELSDWLPTTVPSIVINCSSASGPFLPKLSKGERITITATQSGNELNYSRFGKYLAEAITGSAGDLDHDQEVSLLEAFLYASASTDRFYQSETRLTTEHALLDDTGDGRGTSADFYTGIRPAKEAEGKATIDGKVARSVIVYSSPNAIQLSEQQQSDRARLEAELSALRDQKPRIDEQEYFTKLEKILLQIAELYQAAQQESQ